MQRGRGGQSDSPCAAGDHDHFVTLSRILSRTFRPIDAVSAISSFSGFGGCQRGNLVSTALDVRLCNNHAHVREWSDRRSASKLATIAYLRTGVGRLLMTAARERLRPVGVTEALLWVLDGNVRARRFYEHDGWRSEGACRTVTFGDLLVEQVRYRRTLV
ncbi:MAG TPA: GNAT family N-acetyltransferase [Mycobacterium sp.]|nr:GNAT family N-acetyltransferase [Mycobacterium sp.]HUH70182.1 GNAT family N-acetyltransferase [Mycobacterium sp.]